MKRVLIIICLVFVACSSRPKLYPNSQLKKVGKDKAEQEIDQCMADAEAFLDSPKGKKITKSAGAGAILGGAVGAVSGIFSGNVVRGATQGAAIGGTAGAVGGAMSPDEIKRRYVNVCLQDKGYRVLGWE